MSRKFLAPILCVAFSIACGASLFTTVDLTPRIEENFFFSSDDPQFQGSKRIEQLFDLPPLIVLLAEGDLYSRPYLDRVQSLTRELQSLDGVNNVISLGAGPSSVEGAIDSPLWSRLVVAPGRMGSNLHVFLSERPSYGPLVERINALQERYEAPDFRISITGVPYLVHEIQKQLVEDMRNFTLVAMLAFAVVILLIYRSGWILAGAIVSALTAAFLDFLVLHFLGVNPGPLSANLWSIVFVLTLSHVVFISGNWEQLCRSSTTRDPVKEALRETGVASFWSMATNSLGFSSLLFTAAKPIRQFGLAGLVGAVLAALVAFAVFPVFLRRAQRPSRSAGPVSRRAQRLFSGRHPLVVGGMLIVALVAGFGIPKINSEPPIFSYFERGGRIREDLHRIDRLGGVSPFYVVVRDPQGRDFMSSDAYVRLWRLQFALEEHPAVGDVLSLPLLLSEFVTSPVAPLLTWDLIYDLMELMLGDPSAGYVTPDRKKTLFVVRMQESMVAGPRQRIVDDLVKITKQQGFDPVLTGGFFPLTGELSRLVSQSLLQGVYGLIGLLLVIAWLVSRSVRVALAVVLSLLIVPICVLGSAGFLGLPLEIISTPGINLAIGLGVDEMLHLVHVSKRDPGKFDFEEARKRLWKPISTSCLMLSVGFSMFWLSHFPPSQNLGWLVVIGSAVAWVAMLLVFPTVAQELLAFGRRRRVREVKKAA